MGRIVYLRTGLQTVGAAQDLVELKAGSVSGFIVHSINISCTTDYDKTVGPLIELKRAAGSYTSGSGGGTLVAVKGNSTDAADSFATEARNNTTLAVAGSGTLETFWDDGMPPAAGFQHTPTPPIMPPFHPGEALIVSISNPTDSIDMCVTVVAEEL